MTIGSERNFEPGGTAVDHKSGVNGGGVNGVVKQKKGDKVDKGWWQIPPPLCRPL